MLIYVRFMKTKFKKYEVVRNINFKLQFAWKKIKSYNGILPIK